jgi:hypothetical protein
MKKKKHYIQTLLLWVFFLIYPSLYSQYSDFVRPEKAIKGFDYHILITNNNDFKYLKSHIPQFSNIEKLRIDGPVDVNLLSEIAGKFDNLEELQLRQFQGIISDVDLENIEWIPLVYLYVPQNREDALLLNNYWSRFNRISLEFEVVPDQYDFMKTWKSCKELQIIAPWTRPELDTALREISKWVPKLQKLAVSVNHVEYLTQSIHKFKKLTRLTLIDAASLSTGIPIDNLNEILTPVKIGDKDVNLVSGVNKTVIKKAIHMPLVFLTNNTELLNSELKHIKKIFPDGEVVQDFEWIEPEQKLDFVENLGFSQIKNRGNFPNPISKPLIEYFQEGTFYFEGNNKSNQIFEGERKWVILVPKGGIVNASGEEYLNNYTIKVKVMTNQERLLAFAPNLVYDSALQKFQLNPSFLFDIQAFDGKEILSIKPGYFVEVHFVGTVNQNAHFYALKNQKWVHFYEYDYSFSDDHLAKIDFFQFYQGAPNAKFTGGSDVSGLDEKLENKGYYYLLKENETKSWVIPFENQYVEKISKIADEKSFLLKKGASLIGVRNFISDNSVERGVYELKLYDKTKKLFPELKSFENYPLVFRTTMAKKDVTLQFFKAMKFFDVRIREFGGSYVLELKSNEGLWQIQLLEPKERYKSSPKKAKSEQKKFTSKIQTYLAKRGGKINALESNQKSIALNELEDSKSVILGSNNIPKSKMKRSFLIRSFGRFAFASADTIAANKFVELIPCEPGKIPLKVKQFVVVYDNPMSSICLAKLDRYSLDIVESNILYIACKDEFDRVFVLTGDKFRKLNIQNNTLTYIDMFQIPEQFYSQESILNLFKIKRKN